MSIFLRSRPGNIRLLKELIIMERDQLMCYKFESSVWMHKSVTCDRFLIFDGLDSLLLLKYDKKISYESSSHNYMPSDTKKSDFSRKKRDKITMTVLSKRHLSRFTRKCIRETRTLLFYEILRNLNDRRCRSTQPPIRKAKILGEIKHQKKIQ